MSNPKPKNVTFFHKSRCSKVELDFFLTWYHVIVDKKFRLESWAERNSGHTYSHNRYKTDGWEKI